MYSSFQESSYNHLHDERQIRVKMGKLHCIQSFKLSYVIQGHDKHRRLKLRKNLLHISFKHKIHYEVTFQSFPVVR